MDERWHDRFPRIIEHSQPGDHLCCIYETEEEHRAVLTPFLRQGLERGEKVLYIVDAHTAETILGYLRDEGVDVEACLESGQFAILTRDDAYMQEGIFDPQRMIALLRAETERALAEGYPALRVTGEMTWTLRGLPGSERLIEYEARLNEFFPGSQCLAICQYDRRRFDAPLLLDVLRTHPIAVFGTEVYDNFYYIPPAEFLSGDRAAVELQRWEQSLAQRRRAEEQIRHLNAILRAIRNVNQLITREKDRNRLLKGACESLIRTRGYLSAWIALLDESGGLVTTAEAGLGENFLPLLKRLERGEMPHCAQVALEQADALVIKDTLSTCADCPLAAGYDSKQGMAVRLEHGGKVYGLLTVSIPGDVAVEEEERVLFREVAGDIAFALHGVELEEGRRRAEEALRLRMEQLMALSQASQAVTASLELDQVLAEIVSLASEVVGSDYASVALVDETGQMSQSAENLPGVPAIEYRIRDEGFTSWIVRSRQAMVVDEIGEDGAVSPDPGEGAPRTANPHLVEAGLKSFAGLALVAKDRLLGVLYLHSLRPRAFQGQLPLLTTFANQTAIAIENARLFEETRRLQEFNQSIVQSMAEGIAIENADGVFTFVNPAAAEMLGQHWTAIVTPDQQPIVQAADERQARGESDRYELELVRKDGTRISVLVSGSPRFEDGRFVGTMAVFTDITERKRTEEELQQSYARLRKTLEGIVHVLESAMEMRDPYTAGHQRRVTQLACAIAEEMGLSQERIEGLRMAAMIHDLGKMTVPAEILAKPTTLSDLEYGLIKTHPQTGHDVLQRVTEFPWPVAQIILQHHERLDGSGYPQGLSDGKIMLEAKMLAVADVVEAMAPHRPYRPAHGIASALEEISQNSGLLYDAEVVDVCLKLFTEKGFAFE